MTAPTLAPDSWQLVTRAQAGDTDAFADLYAQYRDTVMRFLQYRVGSRHVAEDLAAEVWIRALRNIGRVQFMGRDFGAWLTTIARNIVNDHFKSGRVRLSTPVEDMHTWDLPAVDDPEAETVAAVQRSSAERLITEAMAQLTPEQKRVIELRFYDGLSTVETAAAMGKQVGAVKAAQTRACASLRRQLGPVSG